MIIYGNGGRPFDRCDDFGPLHSSIGVGPQGDGIDVRVVEDDPYGYYRLQFLNSNTGEVLTTTPNLDPGSRFFLCTADLQTTTMLTHEFTAGSGTFTTMQALTIQDARVGDLVIYNVSRLMSDDADRYHDFLGFGVITSINNDPDAGMLITFNEVMEFDTTMNIENLSIPSSKLANGSVTSEKIANGSVGWVKLADDAVNTDKLADDAVTTDKLANNAVTTEKIGNDAVNTQAIANNVVTLDKISPSALEPYRGSKSADAIARDMQPVIENSNYDAFEIADEDGTIGISSNEIVMNDSVLGTTFMGTTFMSDDGSVLFEVIGGRISTLYGKSISIVGDSISTFNGYLPSGYDAHYPQGDVTTVDKTWWRKLIVETGMRHIAEAAWTNSTVSGDSTSTTGFVGCSDARVDAVGGDNDEEPDIIIVFMGTNDFRDNVPIGNYNLSMTKPSEGVQSTFVEAYSLLLYKLRESYPRSMVFCCTLLPKVTTAGQTEFVINGNGNSIRDYNEAIKWMADLHSCGVIDLYSCGINHYRINELFLDGRTHPNAAGMQIISKCVRGALESACL